MRQTIGLYFFLTTEPTPELSPESEEPRFYPSPVQRYFARTFETGNLVEGISSAELQAKLKLIAPYPDHPLILSTDWETLPLPQEQILEERFRIKRLPAEDPTKRVIQDNIEIEAPNHTISSQVLGTPQGSQTEDSAAVSMDIDQELKVVEHKITEPKAGKSEKAEPEVTEPKIDKSAPATKAVSVASSQISTTIIVDPKKAEITSSTTKSDKKPKTKPKPKATSATAETKKVDSKKSKPKKPTTPKIDTKKTPKPRSRTKTSKPAIPGSSLGFSTGKRGAETSDNNPRKTNQSPAMRKTEEAAEAAKARLAAAEKQREELKRRFEVALEIQKAQEKVF